MIIEIAMCINFECPILITKYDCFSEDSVVRESTWSGPVAFRASPKALDILRHFLIHAIKNDDAYTKTLHFPL